MDGINDIRQTGTQISRSYISLATGRLTLIFKTPKCNFFRINRNRSKVGSVGIHRLNNSVWMKEELHEQWKVCIIVPTYKKGDKTDSTNY